MTLAVIAPEATPLLDNGTMCDSCERALASFIVRDDDAPTPSSWLFLVCASCLPVNG